jgi:hydrogenase maturation factor
MCLTIPKKVIEVKKDTVVVENPDKSRQEIRTIVDLKSGDFCVMQQNIVVQKISQKEADEIFELISEGGQL